MKQITMFETGWCPYCRKAHTLMNELIKDNPLYQNLNINVVDEELHPEVAKQFDYYYVPTYYVNSIKIHEGVPTKESIKAVFDLALNN